MSVKALILSEFDHGAWHADHVRGVRPTPLPYGVEALQERGFALGSVDVSHSRVGTKLRNVVEHRLGLPLERAARGIGLAASADVVIALLEQNGLAPAWAKHYRLPPYAGKPLVIWSCWLADQLSRMPADERRRFARPYYSADLIVHLSGLETEIFLEAGFSAEQLFPMTYGVAAEFYTPTQGARDLDILAVGQDRGRDYGTLFRAVDGTDLRVDVVCKPENLTGLIVPDNVTLHGTVTHLEYRDLIRRAKVMAVPTIAMAYPTGSSVALESAACGDCIVVSDTPAMREYFTDERTALMVPVADHVALRAALRRAMADADLRAALGGEARRSVETRFNTRAMWLEIADVMFDRGLVNRPG